ncbi:transposase [Methylobacterium sp. 1030]
MRRIRPWKRRFWRRLGKRVAPKRRRQAIAGIRERYGLSERHVCRIVGLHRNTHRYVPSVLADIRDSVRRVKEALEQQRGVIERAIDAALDRSPAWRRKVTLVTSVPGIGPTIARTLIAELPEFGGLDRKQVAAFVGLAPWMRQSGQWRGSSFIAGGRAPVRTALFMGAMVASRHHATLKTFRGRLIAAGKLRLVALIATPRKLITILNAISRDGTPWQTA